MSKTLIRNIRRIEGLTKFEFVKRVKAAIGADTINETVNFIEQAESLMQMNVDSNFVPHLRNCFTFEIKSEKELERENYYKERNEKIQKAEVWFNTLTEEQKEFASLLFIPAAG